MNSKLVIIVILVAFIISTLFNVSNIVRNIKLEEIQRINHTETIGGYEDFTVAGTNAKPQDVTGDVTSNDTLIVLMILVQIGCLILFINQEERKVSIPIIILVVAITLLPAKTCIVHKGSDLEETHYVNIYHMEIVKTKDKTVFNQHSEF